MSKARKIADFKADDLTGVLPALDGSNLTNVAKKNLPLIYRRRNGSTYNLSAMSSYTNITQYYSSTSAPVMNSVGSSWSTASGFEVLAGQAGYYDVSASIGIKASTSTQGIDSTSIAIFKAPAGSTTFNASGIYRDATYLAELDSSAIAYNETSGTIYLEEGEKLKVYAKNTSCLVGATYNANGGVSTAGIRLTPNVGHFSVRFVDAGS